MQERHFPTNAHIQKTQVAFHPEMTERISHLRSGVYISCTTSKVVYMQYNYYSCTSIGNLPPLVYILWLYIFILNWLCRINVVPAADKNECLKPSSNRCQHECLNQMGSYTCYCKMGYKLEADGFSCTRKF